MSVASYPEIILVACFLILPFLYESSQIFRYHLKFCLYYGLVMVNSVLLIPVFVFKSRNVRNLLLASTFCKPISTLIGIKWIVRNKEHLAQDQACIIVSNHQSSLDILGLFELWHTMDKCTVIAKRELFYAWPFGLAAWLCGLFFIPRVNTDKAKSIMNEAVEHIKRDKIKLWVFPEGTRRNTGQVHPFKKGAFHLAISSQLPVVPVVFSQFYFLDKKSRRLDQGKVYITALPPISTENMTLDDIDTLMEMSKEQISETFHKVNQELKSSLRSNF